MRIHDVSLSGNVSMAGERRRKLAVRSVVRAIAVAFSACPGAAAMAEQGAPSGEVVSGAAQVVDADIIRFGSQRVILWGIDAPERRQKCVEDGQTWDCYGAARRQLQTLVSRGDVTCYLRGEPDPFGRRFGVCESGEDDINAEMARAGLALAYREQTDAYVDAQTAAIQNERGVWQIGMEFQKPWVFRKEVTPSGYR